MSIHCQLSIDSLLSCRDSERCKYTDKGGTMSELHGYTVEAKLGREHLDISLIASSPESAVSRARMTMFYNRRNSRWLEAEYTVTETVSLETFKAGRKAGTR
jgi:hypothetical protein